MVLSLCLLAASAWSLDADEHTLFLAHFDTGPVADFSVGSPHPEGVVSLTEGKSGKALSAPLGLISFEESTAPITTGIQYPSDGNLNLETGTIEFWVRLYSSILDTTEQSPKLRYLVSCGKHTNANHGFALVLSHFDQKAGTPYSLIWTRANGAEKEKSFAINAQPQWQPGEWHHVAASWSPTEDVLFMDGKCAGRVKTTEGMDLVGSNLALGANHYHGHVADCALDEVRISDYVRYDKDFVP